MRNRSLIYFGFSLLFLLIACKPEDLTPVFITYDKDELKNDNIPILDISNYNLEHEENYDQYQLGALTSHSFKDIWIYINDDSRGMYSLPCKIPILAQDSIDIMIYPAVKQNAMSEYPRYAFVEPYRKTCFAQKGTTIDLSSENIQFRYYKSIQIPILETFEQQTSFAPLLDTGASFRIEAAPEATYKYGSVGVIYLNDSMSFFELVSKEINNLSITGERYFYLEFDYKTEVAINYAVYITTNVNDPSYRYALGGLKASTEWKKAYLNLTRILNANANTATGGINKIKITLDGKLESGQHEAKVYMDNIKLIYR
jgi:hypothetical protein